MYTIHFKYLRGFNFIKTRYKKFKNKQKKTKGLKKIKYNNNLRKNNLKQKII